MKTIFTFSVILMLLSVSCTTNQTVEVVSPLTGVWELVSAEWLMEDTTFVFPYSDTAGKSIKCYTESHFFVVGSMNEVYALSGTYTVEGDSYTEHIGMNSANMQEGTDVEISFSVENDSLRLGADWFSEVWKRIE